MNIFSDEFLKAFNDYIGTGASDSGKLDSITSLARSIQATVTTPVVDQSLPRLDYITSAMNDVRSSVASIIQSLQGLQSTLTQIQTKLGPFGVIQTGTSTST